MRLHNYFRSSTSTRVRVALNLKGLEAEYLSYALLKDEHKSSAYLAANPQGLVPSLELDDGTVLIQSLAIMEWLEETYPEPALLPSDALGRARVRALAYAISCEVHPVNNLRLLGYIKGEFGADDVAVKRWFTHWVEATFAPLEAMLAGSSDTGAFCHGDTPGLADICLYAQVWNNKRFEVDMGAYPVISRIFEACDGLEAFSHAAPPNQPDAVLMGDFGWEVENWVVPERPAHEVMEGQYARLEPFSVQKHAAGLWDAFSEDEDGVVWDYLPEGPFVSLSQFHKFARSKEPSEDPLFFAIRDVETGKLGGFLSFLRIAPEAGSIEVGFITFAPRLQNTKTGTEAVILMARKAFELGYRRFEWKCNALNVGSRRAAERYGFSFEGVFRQAAVVKGRNRDTAWFAMVDGEWDRIDGAYARWLDPRNFVSTGREIHSLRDMVAPVLVARDPVVDAYQKEP